MKTISTKDVATMTLKSLIYGPPGIGKTSTALTLSPKTTLIVSNEGGLLPLTGKDFFGIEIEHWKDLTQLWKDLQTDEYKKKYDTIFVDNLSEIGETCKAFIADEKRPAVRGKVDKIYEEQLDIKDWSLYSELMKRFIRMYRDLPYNLIFTCWEDTIQDDQTGAIMHAPLLAGKKLATSLPGYFDEVFRMVIKGEGAETERYFLTEHTNRSIAKDRSGKLDRLEKPSWETVMQKIRMGFAPQKNVTDKEKAA